MAESNGIEERSNRIVMKARDGYRVALADDAVPRLGNEHSYSYQPTVLQGGVMSKSTLHRATMGSSRDP